MIVDFKKLPKSSKIWIFPSSRKFYAQELPEINSKIKDFLESWGRLDPAFSMAYELRYDHFIIIGLDHSGTSLSIPVYDALTAFIQQLEADYKLQLMDRINVTYKQGAYIQYKELKDFKKMIKSRGVSKKTIVFDNMIDTKESLEYDWEIPITDSWLGRLFPKK